VRKTEDKMKSEKRSPLLIQNTNKHTGPKRHPRNPNISTTAGENCPNFISEVFTLSARILFHQITEVSNSYSSSYVNVKRKTFNVEHYSSQITNGRPTREPLN